MADGMLSCLLIAGTGTLLLERHAAAAELFKLNFYSAVCRFEGRKSPRQIVSEQCASVREPRRVTFKAVDASKQGAKGSVQIPSEKLQRDHGSSIKEATSATCALHARLSPLRGHAEPHHPDG